jgi:hypothetical protein
MGMGCTIAGTFIGTAIADQFFANNTGFDGGADAGADAGTEPPANDPGSDTQAAEEPRFDTCVDAFGGFEA